jgi:hypothetical protein
MWRFVAFLLLLGVVGCGGSAVPVSGRVTLDGKPIADATVTFQPADSGKPGTGSAGKTDANGQFTLQLVGMNRPGALIGKHRISITALGNTEADDSGKKTRDQVPAWYNTQSTLTFEVPSGGTDKANFELSSKPPAGVRPTKPGKGKSVDDS